jgi:hypothetical protein
MPITVIIPSNEIVNSQINASAAIERSKLASEQLKDNIPLELLRVWDAFQTSLPTTAANDDLGKVIGTFGTDAMTIQTSDSKNTSVTQRARFMYRIPMNYVSGQVVSVVAWVGMRTTVANGTATIDFEVYKKNDSTGMVGSDLVSTSATSINSLTAADKAFVIDPTGLTAGDELDIRVTIAITDTGTGTAVIGRIMKLYMLPAVKG